MLDLAYFCKSIERIFVVSLILLITACGGGSKSKGVIAASSAPISVNVSSLGLITSSVDASNNSSAFSHANTSTSSQESKVTSAGFSNSSRQSYIKFRPVYDVEVGTLVVSEALTIPGNGESSISVSNGDYSIDNGLFTNLPGKIAGGQTVRVRLKSAAFAYTPLAVTLSVGKDYGYFSVTTGPNKLAPKFQIVSPLPGSRVEADSVLVQGAVSDNSADIAIVSVNGAEATSSDGFVSWQVSVPLSPGLNPMSVFVEDVLGHHVFSLNHFFVTRLVTDVGAITLDSVNNRVIAVDNGLDSVVALDLSAGTRTTLFGAPSSNTEISFSGPSGLKFDSAKNRILVVDYKNDAVIAVDLATGARTVLSDATTPNNKLGFSSPVDLMLDSAHGRALVADLELKAVIAVDLITGERSVFSSSQVPDTLNPFSDPRCIVMDTLNNRVLVLDRTLQSVIAVNLDTGARVLLSGQGIPDSINPLSSPQGMALDVANNRVLVSDSALDAVIAVDLTSGARMVISSKEVPDAANGLVTPTNILFDDANQRALVLDVARNAVIAVDLKTGKRSVFSK
jgi:hypothetical protein